MSAGCREGDLPCPNFVFRSTVCGLLLALLEGSKSFEKGWGDWERKVGVQFLRGGPLSKFLGGNSRKEMMDGTDLYCHFRDHSSSIKNVSLQWFLK